jgi:hypothetical protein
VQAVVLRIQPHPNFMLYGAVALLNWSQELQLVINIHNLSTSVFHIKNNYPCKLKYKLKGFSNVQPQMNTDKRRFGLKKSR